MFNAHPLSVVLLTLLLQPLHSISICVPEWFYPISTLLGHSTNFWNWRKALKGIMVVKRMNNICKGKNISCKLKRLNFPDFSDWNFSPKDIPSCYKKNETIFLNYFLFKYFVSIFYFIVNKTVFFYFHSIIFTVYLEVLFLKRKKCFQNVLMIYNTFLKGFITRFNKPYVKLFKYIWLYPSK